MKMLIKIYLIGLTISILGSACKKEIDITSIGGPSRDIKTAGDLEATLQVTDMQGNARATFREGDNFMFSFIIKNRGKEDIYLHPWLFPVDIKDFFAVYKQAEQGEKVFINKPFQLGINTYDLRAQRVAGGGEIEYRIPWLTKKKQSYIMPINRPEKQDVERYYWATDPEPATLTKGKYFSGFEIEAEGHKLSFRIEFNIE
jgi:hypothetical protein